MSARSKDMIGATLIAAGIPMAGEIHLAAGGTTGAFQTYWADWFENDRYHNSTNAISVGEAALVEGRGDTLIVAPGTHVISTGLSWSKDLTHLIGVAPVGVGMAQNAILRPAGAAVTTMLTADATGCLFAGLKLRNAAVTASTACISTFKTSTNSAGTVCRNMYFYGPDDATIGAATGGWSLINVEGGDNYFEKCLVGYGWPLTGAPTNSSNHIALVRFQKSVFNASVWKDCMFQGEFKAGNVQGFLFFWYAPSAGVFHVFRNCQFYNACSTALTHAIRADQTSIAPTSNAVFVYFDANCAFKGVTDIGHANMEGDIDFSPAQAVSSTATDGLKWCGIAQTFDHTTG